MDHPNGFYGLNSNVFILELWESKIPEYYYAELNPTLHRGEGHNDPPSAIYAVEPSRVIRGAQNFGTIPIS